MTETLPSAPGIHFTLSAALVGELIPTPFGRRLPVLYRVGIWAAYQWSE